MSPGRSVPRRAFLKGAGAVAAIAALEGQLRGLARAAETLREPTMLLRVGAGGRVAELVAEFDVTEHGHAGWVDVVAHPGDRARLDAAGFGSRVIVPDLLAHDARARAAEISAQRSAPEERLVYRTLADYEADMASLAAARPDLVRMFALPYQSHEGRTVYALEIARDVTAPRDGRPVCAIDGLHHAREWPAAELPMMFAQDLVDSDGADPDVTSLLDRVRLFVTPVVNVDGFVRSREHPTSDWIVPGQPVVQEFAYHRKNLRRNSTLPAELAQGVDLNRNYPFRWGGAGADRNSGSQVYFGPAPGSEPEAANVLSLLRAVPAVTFITCHTYGNLVLRQWGHTWDPTPDEAQQRALGNRMAAYNGYTSEQGIGLYPTTGTTDDWLYAVCGSFGYTFEIGTEFHPQYNLRIAGYYQRNRGAFLEAMRAALDPALHAVLRGTAPAGTVLRARKDVATPLSRPAPGGDIELAERIEYSMTVGPSGTFEWHLNPSPRPETVDAVAKGALPSTALEGYRIEAALPGGGTWSRDLVVVRGSAHTLTVGA